MDFAPATRSLWLAPPFKAFRKATTEGWNDRRTGTADEAVRPWPIEAPPREQTREDHKRDIAQRIADVFLLCRVRLVVRSLGGRIHLEAATAVLGMPVA